MPRLLQAALRFGQSREAGNTHREGREIESGCERCSHWSAPLPQFRSLAYCIINTFGLGFESAQPYFSRLRGPVDAAKFSRAFLAFRRRNSADFLLVLERIIDTDPILVSQRRRRNAALLRAVARGASQGR